ncbi:hypothetical protein MJH12_13595 [bacterium]|nr:hypothetical protein [bacterium]
MAIHLKNYEEVKDRIKRFYLHYSDGRIITNLERLSDDGAICYFKTAIFKNADEQERNLPLASGFAYEVKGSNNVNKNSHVENCETSSIGRALANMNFIKGENRPSKEEMIKVVKMTSNQSSEVVSEKVGVSEEYVKELRVLFKDSSNQDKHQILDFYLRNHGKDIQSWSLSVVKEFKVELLKENQNVA